MKIYIIRSLTIAILLFPLTQACEEDSDPPKRTNEIVFLQELQSYVVENELIVVYKDPAIKNQVINQIDTLIPDAEIVRSCSECDSDIELWEGEDIHTIINATGLQSPRGSSSGAGEDHLAYYSLNFVSHLPEDSYDIGGQLNSLNVVSQEGKDEVVIAVLDTGIEPALINQQFLWKNGGSACYPGGVSGWNFVSNNADVRDDNANIHGTLVSAYIINQFVDSLQNYVQIMNLKTHDSIGQGKLFDIICATRYAKEHNADIINASWGFYDYTYESHAYFKKLITEELDGDSILFFAAAGNSITKFDDIARGEGLEPRNLDEHHFLPAYFSNADNKVITVTTTNGDEVSPTQNYSSNYVDLGVTADQAFRFQIPFEGGISEAYISGSSFATPIAAGKVGAFLNRSEYGLSKQEIMNRLNRIVGPGGTPIVIQNPALEDSIRGGWNIER